MPDKKRKILMTNDDGILAEGLIRLARMAKNFGEVTVVAPAHQCSAMSQRLTIAHEMELLERPDFPVEGVKAWSLEGTPTDCVKVGLLNIMRERPDIVFSGINFGYNAAFDCAYSGTVGAANEALMNNIPAIAFSNGVPNEAVFDGKGSNYEVVEQCFGEIVTELFNTPIEKNAMWNVNFPGCPLTEYKGILRDRTIGRLHPYKDNLVKTVYDDGRVTIAMRDYMIEKEEAPEGSDIEAVLNGYISIGKIYNAMLL